MSFFKKLFKQYSPGELLGININDEALILSNKALENYKLKNYQSAVTLFTEALMLTPENQNLYLMRGTAFEDFGNDLEAENDFRKALEIEKNQFIAAYRMGMVYFRKKDLITAIEWLNISFENCPDGELMKILENDYGKNNILFVSKKVIAANLGNFLIQIKNYDEGFKYLDCAIKLDPKYSSPYMTKGLALVQIGKASEGIDFLKKAEQMGIAQASTILKMLSNG
jgi:tetratricopeptide (TPR) repeat protein